MTRVSPFAKASGDRPPRHADACHPSAEGNFVPRRDGGSSPIRRKGEHGMLLVRAAPRRVIQSWNRHRLNMLCRPL